MHNRLKTFSVIPVLIFCSLFLQNCSGPNLIRDFTYKEKVMNDMYIILSNDYQRSFKNLSTDVQIETFLSDFWKKEYPDKKKVRNEYKAEYLNRLEYANLHFPDEYGWGRSDRKRIYLTYGPPDFIDRYNNISIPIKTFSTITSMEVWHYNRAGKNSSLPTILDNISKGEMKFIFGDITGSGHYQILDSSEDPADIDIRMRN